MSGSPLHSADELIPSCEVQPGQTAETGKVAACYSQIKHNNSLPKQLQRRVREETCGMARVVAVVGSRREKGRSWGRGWGSSGGTCLAARNK